MLRNWLLRRGLPAALAAAASVMTADAGHVAGAQGRLEAHYTASIAGIPIGHGNWVIEVFDDQFTAAASGTTTGILHFFTGGHGTGASHGTVSGGQPMPTSYASNIFFDNKKDDVRIVLAGGNVKEYIAEPPLPPHPERIPVTEADRRGVVDPMTSTLNRVPGTADPLSPQACNRKVSVFDGRVRYDLRSAFKRMEVVKAEKGYQGAAVVCAVYFTPVAGFVPDRPTVKFLIELRDAEVWLAPIIGTRILVPYRFSLPTPIGMGVVQATQFITAALPGRATATAKSQ